MMKFSIKCLSFILGLRYFLVFSSSSQNIPSNNEKCSMSVWILLCKIVYARGWISWSRKVILIVSNRRISFPVKWKTCTENNEYSVVVCASCKLKSNFKFAAEMRRLWFDVKTIALIMLIIMGRFMEEIKKDEKTTRNEKKPNRNGKTANANSLRCFAFQAIMSNNQKSLNLWKGWCVVCFKNISVLFFFVIVAGITFLEFLELCTEP